MNERRHHGQRHLKGGIDINEATMPPNSNYWRGCALGARNRLARVVGDLEADRQVKNIEGTWKEICTAIEMLADLAEHQQKVKDQAGAEFETLPCGHSADNLGNFGGCNPMGSCVICDAEKESGNR